MDSSKLTDEAVEALLKALRPTELPPSAEAYEPDPEIKKEYSSKDLDYATKEQELNHKEQLMKGVLYLSKESFKLLALIVIAQMVIRLFMPKYNGVSDGVVNVIAVSVFGQVIVVVGALATYLFKKGKK